LFVDFGGVKINEKAFVSSANQRHLAGGGIGVSWYKAKNFHVQLTLAARLGHERVTSDADRRVRGWLQVAKAF
jgi:hemolysin activation/secretion protein